LEVGVEEAIWGGEEVRFEYRGFGDAGRMTGRRGNANYY